MGSASFYKGGAALAPDPAAVLDSFLRFIKEERSAIEIDKKLFFYKTSIQENSIPCNVTNFRFFSCRIVQYAIKQAHQSLLLAFVASFLPVIAALARRSGEKFPANVRKQPLLRSALMWQGSNFTTKYRHLLDNNRLLCLSVVQSDDYLAKGLCVSCMDKMKIFF